MAARLNRLVSPSMNEERLHRGATRCLVIALGERRRVSRLPQDLFDGLVEIVLRAGMVIMRHYGAASLNIMAKPDDSPVTQADLESEAVILKGLGKRFGGISIVSEEAASAGTLPASSSLFFLVDPLDGTKEFIAANGEFSVNIALIADGAPIAGIVLAPALGQIFYGDEERGACNAQVVDGAIAGGWSAITVRAAPSDGLSALSSRSHGGPNTERYLDGFMVERRLAIGSSLKFCLIAAGQADLYPRPGPTMQWDTAAGDAVLRAAGGMVVCPDGSPLVYGSQHDGAVGYANPHFVAFGCRSLAGQVAARKKH